MTYTPATLLAFDGVEQPIREHALDFGIPAARIIMRLAAGWSVENAITRPVTVATGMTPRRERQSPSGPRKVRTGKLYNHQGHTLNLAAWSERTGVKIATINYRLRQGLSFAEAISTTELPRGPGAIKRMRTSQ